MYYHLVIQLKMGFIGQAEFSYVSPFEKFDSL